MHASARAPANAKAKIPLTARPLPHPRAVRERERKMASLGLSSLLPRHNGAGAPLVSPSVPVVWRQRKKQGILSHDRPLLRCGARSVMLSHSRASKMSAYVRSSAGRRVLCALEAALSICPNEPQLQLPSAPQRAFFSAEQVHALGLGC